MPYKREFISKCYRIVTITTLMLLFLNASGPSVTAQENQEFMLEEITVTAEKRERTAQKTSIAIDVKDGGLMLEEGKNRVEDILRDTVGMIVRPQGRGMVINIRGIEAHEGGVMPAAIIPVLADGAFQDRSEMTRGGTLDLERVEVLRGPQSALVGASSLIGAVNLITKDPIWEYESSAKIEIGNYDLLNVDAVSNFPLTDATAVRVAGSITRRDGYISSGAGESDFQHARIKYRWQPNDDIDIVLTGSHQLIGGNGQSHNMLLAEGRWVAYADNPVALNGCATADPNDVVAGCPPLFSVLWDGSTYRSRSDAWDDGYPQDIFPGNPFMETKMNVFNADVSWDLGFGTLTMQPSYQTADYKSNSPGLWIESGGVMTINETVDQKTVQFEARLASAPSSNLEWLGGVYYYDTEIESGDSTTMYPGIMMCSADSESYCYNYGYSPFQGMTTFSAFGNFKYPLPFMEDMRIFGGLRYSNDKKEAIGADGGGLGDINGPYSSYTFTEKEGHSWDSTTYRAGLEYDLLKNMMLYVAASDGSKPGSFRYRRGEFQVGEEETLEQIAMGMKSRFMNNKLQVNVEGFYSTFENRTIDGSLSVGLGNVSTTNDCGYSGPRNDKPSIVVSDDCGCVSIVDQNAISTMRSTGVDMNINFLMSIRDRIDLSMEFLDASYDTRPVLSTGEDLFFTAERLLSGIDNPTAAASANAAELAPRINELVNSLVGAQLQNAPDFTLNLAYSHRFTLPGGSEITPKLNMIYKSEYWSGGGNVQKILEGLIPLAVQDGYSKFDFYTTWNTANGKILVTGYVKNLTNEVIMTHYKSPMVSLDPPRTYGIMLQAKF